MQRALVYMSGRNCERYVPAAIDSLMWQTHPAVHVLFVDDASTDATADLAQAALDAHFPGRHTMVRNLESWGKARNAHVHLRAVLSKGDFVAIVDADDQLARADALALLATEYESGHDVVWTRYETDAGAVGKTGPLDPFNAPRIQGWKTSHLFSFRAPLFESVPESYLRDDQGEWFRAACDFAIAYPVLDQTRRYKHLPLVAYRYTASNPASHHNSDPQAQGLNSTRQMAAARQVLAKPPLPCRRWVFGEHPAADEAFASMLTRLQSQPAELAVVAAPDTARSPADPWLQAAAAALTRQCPALLELAMDGQGESPDLCTAWRWWRWLQAGTQPLRVLELGAGELAAPLQAMVHVLGGRMLSVTGERERAVALYARLAQAGVDAEVVHLEDADVGFDTLTAQLPDLSALPDDADGFNVLLVSSDVARLRGQAAALCLPLAASQLDRAGFRVVLWAPDDMAVRQRARDLWGQLVPDLSFIDKGFDGRALCGAPR